MDKSAIDEATKDTEKQKRIQARLKRARAIRARVRTQSLALTETEVEQLAVEVGREVIESILAKKAEEETHPEKHARSA